MTVLEKIKAMFDKSKTEGNVLSYEELSAAIESAGVKLVDLSDGEYVDKAKFEAVEQKAKDAKRDLDAANTKIQEFTELDVEGIKTEAANWKQKAEEAEQNAQKKDYEYRVNALIAGETFTSNAAKKQFVADVISQDMKFDGDTLLGYADYKKTYAERDAGVFASENGAGKPYFAPNRGAEGTPPAALTREEFRKLPTSEKMKLKETQPELFSQLIKK